jgi:hypothetical protein
MSDKQCRYSHVRITESNDARAVIHWPVAQVASDGTLAKTPDRPSYSSFCHYGLLEHASATWPAYEEGPRLKTKLMLNGMTNRDVADLVPMTQA